MDGSNDGYLPDPDFEEDTKDPLVEISLADSTELWLIQWPVNQLQPADFHGKELKLKLHRDGQLGSFESSSGKSYDMISFAAQEPDATVFLPSTSESKIVGKISRRVCLVRYPEPGEFENPSFSNPNLSSQRLEGSVRKSRSSPGKLRGFQGSNGLSHETLTSAHSAEQRSLESPQRTRQKKRHEEQTPNADVSTRSTEQSSRASGPESHITDSSLGSEKSRRKKKKIKIEE